VPPPPVLSSQSLKQRSSVRFGAEEAPCELLPLVHTGMLRVELPDSIVTRLRGQLDTAVAAAIAAGRIEEASRAGLEAPIARPDSEFEEASCWPLPSWADLRITRSSWTRLGGSYSVPVITG